MKSIGLIPSSTGQPGGKETGQAVSHYIEPGGPFARACAELVSHGFEVPYVERWSDEATRKKKAASKTKFNCAACGLNAWAKPDAELICGACEQPMEPQI